VFHEYWSPRPGPVPRQNSGSIELHPFNNVTGLWGSSPALTGRLRPLRKLLISNSVVILARTWLESRTVTAPSRYPLIFPLLDFFFAVARKGLNAFPLWIAT